MEKSTVIRAVKKLAWGLMSVTGVVTIVTELLLNFDMGSWVIENQEAIRRFAGSFLVNLFLLF